VFTVRYGLDLYILFIRNPVFKKLSTGTTLPSPSLYHYHFFPCSAEPESLGTAASNGPGVPAPGDGRAWSNGEMVTGRTTLK
jgi:hypothetical protein